MCYPTDTTWNRVLTYPIQKPLSNTYYWGKQFMETIEEWRCPDNTKEEKYEIAICGLCYTVEFVDQVSLGDQDTIGLILPHDQKIRIARNISAENKAQTLLHEVIHGTLIGLGMNDLSENENLVQGLSQSLHQILKLDLTSFF